MSKTKIKGIDIMTYFVKDANRAIAFYRDVMEMAPTKQWPDQGAEFTLADGATFGLWKLDDCSWEAGSGSMFAVEDAKAAAEYYRAKGAQIEEHVEETPVCFMAFCQDSEGNSFILHQRTPGTA